jgi:hypothetical protein
MMEIDRSPSLNLDSVVLPKGDWEFVLPDNGIVKKLVSFVPGTWFPREDWMDPRLLVTFSCPNCHAIRMLMKGVHDIDHMGRVKPDIQCKAGNCTFHRRVYLDRWNKKPLYAVALEIWDQRKKSWKPEIRYTHAENEAEARFMMGDPITQGFRIVSAGPAIGFFVEDKVGNRLNVDGTNARNQ